MEKNFPVQGDRGTCEEKRPRARARKASRGEAGWAGGLEPVPHPRETSPPSGVDTVCNGGGTGVNFVPPDFIYPEP